MTALQYADSGYPAGAFAHSFGLESAIEEGFVRGTGDLEHAARAVLLHQTARTDAVAAAACARAAPSCDTAAFLRADQRLTASRTALESRQGSLRTGRQMLAVAAACEGDAWIAELQTLASADDAAGNFAAVVGALLGRRGNAPEDAAAAALWCTASGMVNAAVRLGAITHLDAQRLLTALRPVIADAARSSAVADPNQLAGAIPLFEVLSMRHETASTRLFAS